LLDDLELEYESLNESLMDLTMCPSEQREKTFLELLENSTDINEIINIKTQQKLLNSIIPRVRGIVFNGYEETRVTTNRHSRMTPIEVREWLGKTVKPLILDGEKIQSKIAVIVNLDSSAVSRRVKKAYGVTWAEYVVKVQQGIY
jgi:hypothetical protein